MINKLIPILIAITLFLPTSLSSWWLLGMPSTYQSTLELKPTNYKHHCKNLNYLLEKQRELCGLNHNVLQIVSRGAKLGIDECQKQFHMNRWNCTTYEDVDSKVFGGVLDIQSREKAFIYAVSSAGVAYSITRACTKGELSECSCDDRVRTKDTRGKFEWGGCSENVNFGNSFSKEFVDTGENASDSMGLMNLHNNEAGRRSLKANMELVCKCHGVSGSCTVRVCWRKMKQFSIIGEDLARKFDGATHVKIIQRKDRLRLRPTRKEIKRPSKKDLVYLEESPDYCFKNATVGILGTKGRACNATSYGMDGCRLLCCGHGYYTLVEKVEEKCHCKFVWCCKVQCEKCVKVRENHYCK